MAIPINKYPYTDQHELNLDYVLHELGVTKSTEQDMQNDIESLEERVAALEAGGGGGGGSAEFTLVKEIEYDSNSGRINVDISSEMSQYLDDNNKDKALLVVAVKPPVSYELQEDYAIPTRVLFVSRNADNRYCFGVVDDGSVTTAFAAISYNEEEYSVASQLGNPFYPGSPEIFMDISGNANAVFDVYMM